MNLGELFEITFHKRTPYEKRMVKRKIRRARRGTNWKVLNKGIGRPGYVRKKNGKVYKFVRMSEQQRYMKKRVGRMLGHEKRLRK
jgi:hypothetical protein